MASRLELPGTYVITPEEFMTLDEAADYLGVTKFHLRRAWRNGEILGRKIGRQVIITKLSLLDWIHRGANNGEGIKQQTQGKE